MRNNVPYNGPADHARHAPIPGGRENAGANSSFVASEGLHQRDGDRLGS